MLATLKRPPSTTSGGSTSLVGEDEVGCRPRLRDVWLSCAHGYLLRHKQCPQGKWNRVEEQEGIENLWFHSAVVQNLQGLGRVQIKVISLCCQRLTQIPRWTVEVRLAGLNV